MIYHLNTNKKNGGGDGYSHGRSLKGKMFLFTEVFFTE